LRKEAPQCVRCVRGARDEADGDLEVEVARERKDRRRGGGCGAKRIPRAFRPNPLQFSVGH